MNNDLDTRLEQLASTPTGSPPPVAELHERDRRRSIHRARTALAAAAAVVAIAGGVGLYAQSAEPPPEVTSTGSAPQPSTAPPQSTPTVAPQEATAKSEPLGRLGFTTRLDQLPQGLSIADEAETGGAGGRPTYAAISLSPDGSRAMHGDGPYLRFTAGLDPAGESNIATHIANGAQQVTVQGVTGVVIEDQSTDPQNLDLPNQMNELQNPWVSVVWLDEAGNSLAVQGKGVGTDTLLKIAEGTHYQG